MINSKLVLDVTALPSLENPTENEQILLDFIQSLSMLLQEMATALHSDLSDGTVEHTITSTIPDASTIEEGQIKLYESGATRRIYTKVNGTIRYVDLT